MGYSGGSPQVEAPVATPALLPHQSSTLETLVIAVSLGTNAASLLVPTLLCGRGVRVESALMNRNDMYGGIIVTTLVFTWGSGYIQ